MIKIISFISLDNIVKAYNGKIILHHINLEIVNNQFISIKGPSGVGKSTLLNILAGLEKADSGKYILDRIEMHAQNLNELSEIRGSRIGYISQYNPMIRNLTVRENIVVPLLLGNYNQKQITAYLDELSACLKINHLLDKKIDKLSGGERQRVGVIRALIKKPILLIADEPTGSLDDDTTILVFHLFKRLSESGTTIVMATHSHLSSQYADKEYRMSSEGIFLNVQTVGDM
ncbi:Lipoprotein-releasing system ATP-binding protein LolD [Lysinibacillus sphaericus]|uniref:Lipoprotein-releasing system ATP-binding protein LolD n=1 Tax=Lysinibacillus sphaericus TaxID=1421 RepID=A0A2S5CUM1_LYSSH|nr:ABC transporter ATP-binding protein [Lysinibacillus sphaericus]POZ54486.1 Lipoprotein-releasing system ATP-binding protein LolD [Lysinibacillus sphaericus]